MRQTPLRKSYSHETNFLLFHVLRLTKILRHYRQHLPRTWSGCDISISKLWTTLGIRRSKRSCSNSQRHGQSHIRDTQRSIGFMHHIILPILGFRQCIHRVRRRRQTATTKVSRDLASANQFEACMHTGSEDRRHFRRLKIVRCNETAYAFKCFAGLPLVFVVFVLCRLDDIAGK